MFTSLFHGDEGLLRQSATILTYVRDGFRGIGKSHPLLPRPTSRTHNLDLLPEVDNIVVLKDGQQVFFGSHEAFLATSYSKDRVVVARATSDSVGVESMVFRHSQEKSELMTVEAREFGRTSPTVWWCWIKAAGGISFLGVTLLALAVDRCSYFISDWFVMIWSQSELEENTFFGHTFKSQAEGRSAQHKFVFVYVVLLSFSTLAAIFRSEWIGT